MNIKLFFGVLFLCLLLTGCSVSRYLQNNISRIDLGMSKNEVNRILGKQFVTINYKGTDAGSNLIEEFLYSFDEGDEYYIVLVNDKVVEIVRQPKMRYIPVNPLYDVPMQ